MKLFYLLISIMVIFSCKNKTKISIENSPKNIEIAKSIKSDSISLPVSNHSHLPRLVSHNGTLHMTWIEMNEPLAVLKYSHYKASQWTPPVTLNSGTDWFINWADFPSLAINGTQVLTNILKKTSSDTYDYDVILNSFSTSKKTKNHFLLNTDGISAEHGFVSMKAYKNGYFVSWLDGRNTKHKDAKKNQMSLRNAFVDLKGKISKDLEIDDRVCDCCSTATAITKKGPIVVYRDRSKEPIETRDISIVRYNDGLWTAPKPVYSDSWKLNGCPVNGPAVDTKENQVVVAWFTAQNNTPRVMVALSNDNGEHFNVPQRIDSGHAIGRLDVSFLKDRSILISWLEPKEEQVLLQTARIDKDGHRDKNRVIAQISGERQSGFPQLEVINDRVYVAWTEIKNETPKIKMLSYHLF